MDDHGGEAGVGERLRRAREAKGYSRAVLARKTGIGEKTITKAELRASAPEAETLLVLARALDQDPWFLTFGETATLPTSADASGDLAQTVSHLAQTVEVLRQELLSTAARQEASVAQVQQRLLALEEPQDARKKRAPKAG